MQTVTVDELKQRTQHETGLEIVHQRLIFNVTQLKDGELLSSYCGMGDNATVTVVHRLNGGSNRVVDPSVQRCKGPCVITSVVYDEPECVVMPCGHVIHPDQLVEFYHSEVCNYHKLEILCFMPGCNQIFNMEFLVKCGATQEELNLLSKGMAVNICAFNRDNSIQHCPECMCYCERISERQNVVRCSQCTQKNGKPFDFCSLCSLPWTSGHQCCKVNETLDILAKCEETTINGVKCPGIRLCPKCGVLIEHKEACKHMTCLMCKQEFCFVCLRLKTSSWQCGSHNSPCEPAPRQTAIVGAK